jgi:hypothetical protein
MAPGLGASLLNWSRLSWWFRLAETEEQRDLQHMHRTELQKSQRDLHAASFSPNTWVTWARTGFWIATHGSHPKRWRRPQVVEPKEYWPSISPGIGLPNIWQMTWTSKNASQSMWVRCFGYVWQKSVLWFIMGNLLFSCVTSSLCRFRVEEYMKKKEEPWSLHICHPVVYLQLTWDWQRTGCHQDKFTIFMGGALISGFQLSFCLT